MYKRVNNSRSMVAAITGIVMVMSIFTWLMYGIANRIEEMAGTMIQIGHDMHTMTEVQTVMVNDIALMTTHVSNMSQNMALMTRNTANINANMARMGYDVGRTSRVFTSPMSNFWNMGQ